LYIKREVFTKQRIKEAKNLSSQEIIKPRKWAFRDSTTAVTRNSATADADCTSVDQKAWDFKLKLASA
jgi:hypothetical protein